MDRFSFGFDFFVLFICFISFQFAILNYFSTSDDSFSFYDLDQFQPKREWEDKYSDAYLQEKAKELEEAAKNKEQKEVNFLCQLSVKVQQS